MKYKASYFLIIILFVLFRNPFLRLISNIQGSFNKQTFNLEIKLLKEQNDYLISKYEELLDFKNNINIEYNYTITNTFTNSYSFNNIYIKGDNYLLNSEVVDEDGLIGIISKINNHYSEVKPLYKTNILVKINEISGKISSYDENLNLIVSDLSNYDKINLNDKVYSGSGNYIGKVIQIKNDDFDRKVYVKMAGNLEASYVAVVGIL